MPTRVEDLAAQFEATTQNAIDVVQSCSDAKWRTPVPDDGRTVGVLAHHMAAGDVPIGGLVQAIANGAPMPPLTAEMINQGNANHAQQFANVTKDEAVEALRQNGVHAAAILRALTDAQLDRSAQFLGTQWTTESAIQQILIGHIAGHTETIRVIS
jgi:DinB superfamily